MGRSLGKMIPHSPRLQHTVNLPSKCLISEGTRLWWDIYSLWRIMWIMWGVQRNHVKSTMYFTSYKLCCSLLRVSGHLVTLFICIWPKFFLYSDSATTSTELLFCNLQTRSLQIHFSWIHPEEAQTFWWIKNSVLPLFKGPTVLLSIHSNIIRWTERVLMN